MTVMIKMVNNPLTEQDIITMREQQVLLLEDVQSAKRLLKYQIGFKSAFIEHMTELQQKELYDIIDACFQISDDGDDKK
jgi:hypothetical protein